MLALAKPKKAEGRKRGRKASGLRGLPPEAVALAVNREALAIVRRAVATREDMARRVPNSSRGLPTLERLMRDDVAMALIKVPEEGQVEMRPVLRAATLEEQLFKALATPGDTPEREALAKAKAWVGERFARDVEAMTIGKLTANYEGGASRSDRSSCEPERMLIAMNRVHRATRKLNRQERTAVWAILVFGLSMTDTGWALHGGKGGASPRRLREAAWLFIDAGLEKMLPYYQGVGDGVS